MSAFICSRNHIVYLIQAGLDLARRRNEHAFSWYWHGQWHEMTAADPENCAEVANMLWRENMRSVSHRYPNESSATLPGPRGESSVIQPHHIRNAEPVDPVQVLKSAKCYDYQCCETDDWEDTWAFAFVRALIDRAINCLPGYDEAVWGAPDKKGVTK